MKQILLLAWIAVVAVAQQTPAFMKAGMLQNNSDNTTTVVANDPQPLGQAIESIRQEYGWQVNYEMPAYFSHYDLVDNTDPKWRAHYPQAKGVTRAAGGLFSSSFPSGSSTSEEEVLRKVVSDYNVSGNPGRFELRKESDGRYSVVGIAVRDEAGKDLTVAPILDTPLTITKEDIAADAALDLLRSSLSSQTGKKVILGAYPAYELHAAHGVIGGENVPARVLLTQILALTHRPIVWDIRFIADTEPQIYVLNLDIAKRPQTDAFGNRILIPIDVAWHPKPQAN